MPGHFHPVDHVVRMAAHRAHVVTRGRRPPGRLAGREDLLLGFSMVRPAGSTAIAWSSLLPDRRDTLILGALPVRAWTVIGAKLAALAGYIGLVAVGTHAVGSVFWGWILGDSVSLLFSLRGVAAHFLASSAASVSVFLAATAVQGLALTIVGPRLFRRTSTVLQVVLVALAALGLAILPTLNTTVVATLAGGARAQPWILLTPPVWFLGSMNGCSAPAIHFFDRSPAARESRSRWRQPRRRHVSARVPPADGFGRRIGERAEERSGTCHSRPGRVDRRPASGAASGGGVLYRDDRTRRPAAVRPGNRAGHRRRVGFAGPARTCQRPQPTASLLALPLAVMMFLLAGLRVARLVAVGRPRPSWLFEVHDLSRRHAGRRWNARCSCWAWFRRSSCRRRSTGSLWGGWIALTHTIVMLALGVALVELLIWHCNGMPCGQRWTPARMDFGRRWPLHFALFLIVAVLIPRVELLLFRSVYATSYLRRPPAHSLPSASAWPPRDTRSSRCTRTWTPWPGSCV